VPVVQLGVDAHFVAAGSGFDIAYSFLDKFRRWAGRDPRRSSVPRFPRSMVRLLTPGGYVARAGPGWSGRRSMVGSEVLGRPLDLARFSGMAAWTTGAGRWRVAKRRTRQARRRTAAMAGESVAASSQVVATGQADAMAILIRRTRILSLEGIFSDHGAKAGITWSARRGRWTCERSSRTYPDGDWT
jgi:hypothetical protein